MNANLSIPHAILVKPWYIKKTVVSGVLRMITAGWPNILWQHIILQLNISGHEYRSIFWGQLNVLSVCLTIQIKRGVLWDLRDLWCGFSACASFNSWVTSAIPVFTTTTPEPTQTGCSTGFWVAIQFDLHNNSEPCTLSFKQFNYPGGWEVTSLCIVVSGISYLLWVLKLHLLIDIFTLPFHSPDGKEMPTLKAVKGVSQSPLKNRNSHHSLELKMRSYQGIPQPIFRPANHKRFILANWRPCLIPQWQSYSHQARTV